MTLVKVVANDSSYCSKFFLFQRNLKIEGARAKNRYFSLFFTDMVKIYSFLALAPSILRFRWNKKNLEQ